MEAAPSVSITTNAPRPTPDQGPSSSSSSDVVAMTTGTSVVSVDAPVDQHCKQKVGKVCGGDGAWCVLPAQLLEVGESGFHTCMGAQLQEPPRRKSRFSQSLQRAALANHCREQH